MKVLKEVPEIEGFLRRLLAEEAGELKRAKDSTEELELIGNKPVQQGRQRVAGHYFCSVVPKAKDVRLYFFPLYTHKEAFRLSPELQKKLKGKTCFHLKNLDENLQEELRAMVKEGLKVYQADALL